MNLNYTKKLYVLFILLMHAVPTQSNNLSFATMYAKAQLALEKIVNTLTNSSSNVNSSNDTQDHHVADNVIQLRTSYKVDQDWGSGYEITVRIKNNSSVATTSWQASFSLPNTQERISSFWDGNYTMSGRSVKVTSIAENSVIPAGGSTSFGFVVKRAKPRSSRRLANLQATGTTDDTPPQPTLPAPVLNAITLDTPPNNYTVSWSSVPSATSYTLQQSTSSSFNDPVNFPVDTATSKSFTNQANGTYYYRVYATNDSGNSPYSSVQSITISSSTTLASPVLQPINNAGSSQYRITWSTVPNAQTYKLEQSTSSSFSNPAVIFSGAATSYQVTNQASGTYYYRVTALAGSLSSSPSGVQSATVTPQPQPSTGAIVEGYWESWNTNDSISSIIAMKAEVLDVSFVTFSRTGTNTFSVVGLDTSLSNLTQFVSAAHAAGKKVKIAVGGASYALGSFLRSTQDAQGMAAAIAQFVRQYSLDGVDWDIEDSPAANLQIALIQYTRQQLGNNYIISYTPATPASTTAPFAQVIAGAHQYLDYISMMAYDAYSGYNYKDDVQALIKMGVPASKIVVGFMPGNDDIGIHTSLNMIKDACQYILTNKLHGIMFWSLNRDLENITGLGSSAATNAAWSIIHG